MFNNKKGDMPTLEEIVKFIPHFGLALLLIFIILGFYKSCISEARDQRDFDFERMISEMKELGNGDSITVPINGKDYNIAVFPKNSSESHFHCAEQTCICLYKSSTYDLGTSPNRCEIFRTGGKIVGLNCLEGTICLQIPLTKIDTQTKATLEKKNNIVTITFKK